MSEKSDKLRAMLEKEKERRINADSCVAEGFVICTVFSLCQFFIFWYMEHIFL